MGGPDQEVEGLVDLVGQEDLKVDVGESVQLKKKKRNYLNRLIQINKRLIKIIKSCFFLF